MMGLIGISVNISFFDLKYFISHLLTFFPNNNKNIDVFVRIQADPEFPENHLLIPDRQSLLEAISLPPWVPAAQDPVTLSILVAQQINSLVIFQPTHPGFFFSSFILFYFIFYFIFYFLFIIYFFIIFFFFFLIILLLW